MATTKEKRAAYMRTWNAKNRERVNRDRLARHHERLAAEPDYREMVNERSRRGYHQHRAERKAWQQAHHAIHPMAKAVYRANWFARKNGIHGFLTLDEVEVLVLTYDRRCAYCQKRPVRGLDHVVAFSQGGLNVIDNVLPCCRPCNSSKKAVEVARWRAVQAMFRSATHKQCLECRQIKPRTEFPWVGGGNKEPHAPVCKHCR